MRCTPDIDTLAHRRVSLNDFPAFGEHIRLGRLPRHATIRSLGIGGLQGEGVDVDVRLRHLGLCVRHLKCEENPDSIPALTTYRLTRLQSLQCFAKVVGFVFFVAIITPYWKW